MDDDPTQAAMNRRSPHEKLDTLGNSASNFRSIRTPLNRDRSFHGRYNGSAQPLVWRPLRQRLDIVVHYDMGQHHLNTKLVWCSLEAHRNRICEAYLQFVLHQESSRTSVSTMSESQEVLSRADHAQVFHVDVLLQILRTACTRRFKLFSWAREAESIVRVRVWVDFGIVVAAVFINTDH
jgi:hypothetical protein